MCDKLLLLLLNFDIPWRKCKSMFFQRVMATHNIMNVMLSQSDRRQIDQSRYAVVVRIPRVVAKFKGMEETCKKCVLHTIERRFADESAVHYFY